MKETLSEVARAINQEPVVFEITLKAGGWKEKLLQKAGLFKDKRKFEIRPLTLGTLMRISDLLLSIELEGYSLQQSDVLQSSYHLMKKHNETLARIVALAIGNKKQLPDKAFVDFLLYHLTSRELQTLLNIVIKQMDISGFIHSIISVKGLSVLSNEGKKRSEMSQS